MTYFDRLSGDAFFADSVSPSNFILYVLVREYVTLVQSGECDNADMPSRTIDVYRLMYDILRGSCKDPFACLNADANVLPSCFFAKISECFERLRNPFETLDFTHLSSLKGIFTLDISACEEEVFVVMRDSVFGVFMRKFALAFHSKTFEETVKFLDKFYEAYDTFTCKENTLLHVPSKKDKNLQQFPPYVDWLSTHENALELASNVVKEIGLLGGRPSTNPGELYHKVVQCLASYPKLPIIHYATHLLTTRKRNFTEAEYTLHSYFDALMAADGDKKGFNASCAYMAVAAAVMHISFGHWNRGRCLEKEALKKALECDSKAPLRHVKVTHTLVNNESEPFRYGEEVCGKKVIQNQHISAVEMQTGFWDLVDTGSPPSSLLTYYFNSIVARLPTYFTTCLLDLATLWGFYGYPILSTVLQQCIISSESLQPSPTSDVILANTLSCLVKEFSAHGAVSRALSMVTSCEVVLCRFSETSLLRRANLEVQLDQALHSGHDLERCSRLVEALRSFCPWEAALRQAELEQVRGNLSLSNDILYYIITAVSKRLDEHLCNLDSQTCETPFPSAVALYGCKPFTNVNLPEFPKRTSVGERAKLAQVGLRALFAQVHILLLAGLFDRVESSLTQITGWSDRLHLSLGKVTVELLRHLPLLTGRLDRQGNRRNISTRILDGIIGQVMHRLDRSTRHRCLVFATRVRLREFSSLQDTSILDPLHINVIFEAFTFYRMIDDRKRLLDVIAILAAALHIAQKTGQRNQMSRIFHCLVQNYKPLQPGDPEIHTVPLI